MPFKSFENFALALSATVFLFGALFETIDPNSNGDAAMWTGGTTGILALFAKWVRQ